MAFDISFWTCNLGTEVRRRNNPFTGEPMEIHVDRGLTNAEREGVVALLKEVKAKGPDPDCYYEVTFPDGGLADIDFGNLDGEHPSLGFGVEVRVLTKELTAFLFRLAQVANMSIRPIMKEEVVILTSSPQDQQVRQRWPKAVVVHSSAELEVLLVPGYEHWKQYLNQLQLNSAFENN